MDNSEKQELYHKIWEKHKNEAITDEEGTYVNLKNFNIADHGLTMEDTRAPGNQSLSPTKNQERGYRLTGNGNNYRLFKSM